jgi:hypothetical protein
VAILLGILTRQTWYLDRLGAPIGHNKWSGDGPAVNRLASLEAELFASHLNSVERVWNESYPIPEAVLPAKARKVLATTP